MFRVLYRVGLLLGAVILALFIGAKLINLFDPYRVVTESLISQVAAEPQRTVRLNEYSNAATQIRQLLYTEEAVQLAAILDDTSMTWLIDLLNFTLPFDLFVNGVDTAVHKIAALDAKLVLVHNAETLSGNLAQLRYYDLDSGDVVLANLYAQSTAVSANLAEMGQGLDDVATAVSNVTTLPGLEKAQQTLGKLGNGESGLVYQSIESWQGLPDNLWSTKQRIDNDVAWLDDFEWQYGQAKAFNDRWHFDSLRILPRFVAEFYQPLLLIVIGSLLLAIASWVESRRPASVPQTLQAREALPPVVQPALAFLWPDGRSDCQPLPSVGELTIGNIIIRRARVRYYLQRIDDAFPAFLNGHSVGNAHLLNDGDVLQIGELQTVFQLAT